MHTKPDKPADYKDTNFNFIKEVIVWATITEDDYKVFGGQLEILLQTIKNLYDTCKKQPREMNLKEETQKLGMNYSALYELNSDIVNFRIKLPQNEEMKQALHQLAELDHSNATNRA